MFLRCTLADRDAAFPKYPVLPVRECAGYEPSWLRDEQRQMGQTD